MRLPHKGRALTITSFAAVGVLVAGGIAWATIPDSEGVIHGCYAKKGGSVKVIDTEKGATCPTGYLPLDWNEEGIPGTNGTNGVDGVDGAPATVLTWSPDPVGTDEHEPEHVGSTTLPAGTVLKALTVTNFEPPSSCVSETTVFIFSSPGTGFRVEADVNGNLSGTRSDPVTEDSHLVAGVYCRNADGGFDGQEFPWGFTLTASKTDPYTYN